MDFDTQKLATLEEDLKRDLDAIQRVRKLISFKNGALSSEPKDDPRQRIIPLEVRADDTFQMSDDSESVPRAPSLRGTIESIINSDPSVRWTTQKMLAYLQKTGYDLKAQKPVYSIGQALQKLVDADRIRIIQRGAGSSPNIYKGKVAKAQEEGEGMDFQK